VDRHTQRAPDRSIQQRTHHGWPASEQPRESVIEDRDGARLEHLPLDVVGHEVVIPRSRRRLQHVALSNQLGARRAGEDQVSRDEPFEHEEPESAATGIRRGLPDSAVEALDLCNELRARLRDLLSRNPQPQFGFLL
jgi:hypothetical protein